MLGVLSKKIFGTRNDRYLKKLRPAIDRINSLEETMKTLSDSDFPAYISRWKQEVENGKSLDTILPDVFALVREAGQRVLKMRHFDAQLLGGMTLHAGKIAEMKTGEGKTLVATLPAVLNALSGKGVHLITVNDYLASRDAKWMGQLYSFLGLSVGTIVHGLDDRERQQAYAADITYGTNNEFGFDYLRDNMKFYSEQLVQRELNYAIVDEVDSILIDEARTPLIISGQAEDSTSMYEQINRIILFPASYLHGRNTVLCGQFRQGPVVTICTQRNFRFQPRRIESARRPCEFSFSHDVDMYMLDSLKGIFSGVYYHAIPVFQFQTSCNFRDFKHDVSH